MGKYETKRFYDYSLHITQQIIYLVTPTVILTSTNLLNPTLLLKPVKLDKYHIDFMWFSLNIGVNKIGYLSYITFVLSCSIGVTIALEVWMVHSMVITSQGHGTQYTIFVI